MTYDLRCVKDSICKLASDNWWSEVFEKSKLRSYAEIKEEASNTLGCENLKSYNRSLLAKLMCGILLLEVETGRYVGKT